MRPVSLRLLFVITAALVLVNAALLLPAAWLTGAARPGPALTGAVASAARPLRVGLVFDVGGRGDKSFNDAAYNGVARAARELGIVPEFVEPGDGADRESGLRLLAARGFDLVLGVGFVFSDDMIQVARDYPRSSFACVDYAKFDEHGFVMPPANMVALKFREEEGSFLVGAVAALWAQDPSAASAAAPAPPSGRPAAPPPSRVIGFVGGMDIPLIRKFEAGYRQGALAVCPDCRVLVGYAGTSPEAFKNPAKGKELALAQYTAGAAVIFQAAGSTGLGVFEAARERDRRAIGVDSDQWDEAPGYLVTSMTKQVDVSVYEVIRAVGERRFQPGVRVFGLKEGGVDYVYDEPRRGMLSQAVRDRVEALRREIIAGRITVVQK
ncbi:MAG TPA: BMP family ABC transporter substrate-binding protein [Pseudomonadota bacterium]|nr:BMP family ABC transporter substrate-binding protein [Pseudomonadota bacterium]